ncbi:MAG: tetratricopeptide repeat protein [Acidobacteria bacterium]|nr:tetratricopeptide repeat protein [Acidobacteriota bacterium]
MRPLALFTLASVLAVPVFAQKDKILEIQRDVALLQNEVRSMKSSMDEKFAALNVLVQQSLDTANKSNTSLAILDKTLGDRLKDQQTSLQAPVAGVNTKVDQMATEFALMKESVSEVAELIKKLQSQLGDMNNAVRTLSAPPPAPAPAAPTGPPAGITSESLYTAALAARNGGQLDFAAKQLEDYLKFFPTESYAPNAQFNLGLVYMSLNRYDDAVKALDAVLEKYPDYPKALDAQLEKARALGKSGQRTAAVNELRNLIKKAPSSAQAVLAKDELKALGMSTPPATPAPGRRKR